MKLLHIIQKLIKHVAFVLNKAIFFYTKVDTRWTPGRITLNVVENNYYHNGIFLCFYVHYSETLKS